MYSATGFNKLITNFEELEPLIEYSLTDPIHMLRMILRELEAGNWDHNPAHHGSVNYYYLMDNGTVPVNVDNTTVAEAAEYVHKQERVVLINLPNSEFNLVRPLNVNIVPMIPPTNIATVQIDFCAQRVEISE